MIKLLREGTVGERGGEGDGKGEGGGSAPSPTKIKIRWYPSK